MKRAVYKWALGLEAFTQGNPSVLMPQGAQIVSVQEQHGLVTWWALVDPDATPVERTFKIVGTGHREVDAADMYVGTVLTHGGDYVWHLFEVRPVNPAAVAAAESVRQS